MNNELMVILEEIKSDIRMEKPSEVNFGYSYGELQVKFNGFNWSSYCVTSKDMEILELELKGIKLSL